MTRYAQDVVAGKIVTGRRVRLVCERHLRDLERSLREQQTTGNREQRAGRWGMRFDVGAADRAIKFFGFLRLAEGDFAGKPFKLEPWQVFIVGSLFGWRKADGTRRFRIAYIEIGKGNGKTPMAAAIGLLLTIADGEQSAEVYSAATKLDQAKICFRDAEKMVDASPALSKRISKTANNLAFHATGSFFRAVSSERRGLDGPRVHGAMIDELHEHPDDTVVEKIIKGTKGRRQALIVMITNSGHDRHSVCWHYHDLADKVLAGVLEDDEFFPYVCGLDACASCFAGGKMQPSDDCDDCDDWRDESVWVKANPNLGVSISREYLRAQVRDAVNMPHKRNITLRLNFCVWTEQVSLWIPMDRWDACGEPFEASMLRGHRCIGGLDLSSQQDLTSLCLRFLEDPDELVRWLWWFWIPEDHIDKREDRDGVPFRQWVREGWVRTTPGAVVDYGEIKRVVLEEVTPTYELVQLRYDPWNATYFATQLEEEGVEMVELRQGYASLSEPAKAFESHIVSGRGRHGNNPVVRWMITHLAKEEDAAGNIKPSKRHSADRIDGPVAAIIAESGAIGDVAPKEGVYERRARQGEGMLRQL